MAKITFWNTFATADLERARAFYSALGFAVNDMPPGAGGITVAPDESSLICLFPTRAFAGMIPGEICDTARSQEIVQSISTETREGVDEVAARVEKAGGRLLGKPEDKPYGYGFGFADPDGHVWAVLWMPAQRG